MITAEFAGYVRDLRNDQWGTKGSGIAAAEFFKKAAASGRDISSVVDELVRAYLDSNQLPMMIPIADALAVHYLNRKDFEKLFGLLKRKAFSRYIVSSLSGLASRGKDISEAVPYMVGAFASKKSGLSKYDLSNILLPFVKKSRKRLSLTVRLIGAESSSAAILPWFLNEYLNSKKGDLSEFIPILLEFFKSADDNLKTDSARAILNIFRNGGNLADHFRELEKLLADKNEEVRTSISFTLASFYLKNKDTKNAGRIFSHTDAKVREGSVCALLGSLKAEEIETNDGFARLVKFLLDPAESVRRTAAKGLEDVRQTGIDPETDIQTLALLAGSLCDIHIGSQVSPYLYAYCSKDSKRAEVLLSIISKPEFDKNDPAVSGLVKVCEEKISGTFFRACEICRFLPRDIEYSHELDVPKEVEKLVRLPYGGLIKCPSCGTYYYSHFSQEYESPSDGMGVLTTIIFRRIDPPEALTLLKGEDLESYKRKYDGLIDECVKNLEHFQRFVRENSAWDLTHHYLSKNMTEEIAGLLGHRDPSVRDVVSKTLTGKLADNAIEPAAFVPALTRGLSDPSDSVKRDCSMALGKYYFDRKMFGKFNELLSAGDSSVKLMAVRNIAVRAEETDISPFVPELLKLIFHPEYAVRSMACSALGHVSKLRAPALIESLMKALESRDAGIRSDALDLLKDMAHNDIDISAAVPAISKLLTGVEEHRGVSVRYLAVRALQAAAGKGIDVSHAYLPLLEVLKEKGDSNSGDITYYIILTMKNVELTKAVPVFAKMLSIDGHSMNCALDALQKLSEKKGTDITAAEKELEEMMLCDAEYDGSRARKALAWHYLNQKQWEKIAKFLEHDRRDIRADFTAVIREYAVSGADISHALPPLMKNLAHEYEYLRNNSFEALSVFLPGHKEFAGTVLAELEKLKKNKRYVNINKLTDLCRSLLGR